MKSVYKMRYFAYLHRSSLCDSRVQRRDRCSFPQWAWLYCWGSHRENSSCCSGRSLVEDRWAFPQQRTPSAKQGHWQTLECFFSHQASTVLITKGRFLGTRDNCFIYELNAHQEAQISDFLKACWTRDGRWRESSSLRDYCWMDQKYTLSIVWASWWVVSLLLK